MSPQEEVCRARALLASSTNSARTALAVLTGLHIWLTRPRLFQLGIIEEYWMLIVMVVAFAGAGLSEWFHRLKMPVLCEPLERTALALPAALPGRPSALAPKQSRTRVPRTFTRPAGGGELTSLRIHPFTKSRNHLQIT